LLAPDFSNYLKRLEQFAETCGLTGWLIGIWIARILLLQAGGRTGEARRMLQTALGSAAQAGYFRIFLDESDVVRPLLESVKPLLKDSNMPAFVMRLQEAMPRESTTGKIQPPDEKILSGRELEVLRLLTTGQSYKEIGEQLYLSLNTVQFHVKNIYSKLSVNRRVQAIEKAREMKTI